MLNEFVHRIFFHKADKSSGMRSQKIQIFLNLIDEFDVSFEGAQPTPEELVEEKKLRIKREKQREANRRWYAKQKEKRQQEQQPKSA